MKVCAENRHLRQAAKRYSTRLSKGVNEIALLSCKLLNEKCIILELSNKEKLQLPNK